MKVLSGYLLCAFHAFMYHIENVCIASSKFIAQDLQVLKCDSIHNIQIWERELDDDIMSPNDIWENIQSQQTTVIVEKPL